MGMSDDRPTVVLDAWAIVAYYQGQEPARSAVEALVSSRAVPLPAMSVMAHMEIFTSVVPEVGLQLARKFHAPLREFVQVIELDASVSDAMVMVMAAYWMSMAESMAVVTALRHDAELWTGDPKLLCDDRIWRVRDLRGPAGETTSTGAAGPVGLRRSARQQLERDGLDLSVMVRQALH